MSSPAEEAMRAFVASIPILESDSTIASTFFKVSSETVTGVKKVGNTLLLAIKSHPYVAVAVGVLVVSGAVLYVCSTEDNPQRSVAPETLQRDVAQQPCVLQTAHLMKQENHPLRGGCVNVVYPSITSDPDTQKRVLGVCCICLDRAADTLTLPCKHRTMCAKCFTAKTISICPIDRQPIKDCLKIV